jgi:hypothetical protein
MEDNRLAKIARDNRPHGSAQPREAEETLEGKSQRNSLALNSGITGVSLQRRRRRRRRRFSTSALGEVGWSAPHPGRFTPGKDPVPIVQEVGWAPGPVWTCAKNLAPTGIIFVSNQQSQYSVFHALMCWLSLTFKLSNVMSPLQPADLLYYVTGRIRGLKPKF